MAIFRIRAGRGVALAAACGALLLCASPAGAWDAQGHRLITLLALDHLSGALPSFLHDSKTRATIAENATEPDRWRSVRLGALMNANNLDHYIDLEDLEAYGLSLETIPPMRYEFVSRLVEARVKAGDAFKGRPVNAARDVAKTDQWPGFVPYAVAENYGKLVATFKTLRTLEKLADPARNAEVEAAQASAAVIMGVLSHYVGDIAQPLHTTRHHHGWVGDNPGGYSTAPSIHAYIDGKVLDIHKLSYETMKGAELGAREVDGKDPWPAIVAHVSRSHDKVVPLYEMEKSGSLAKDEGKAMISERLADGAAMLAALYNAAWEAAEPSAQDVESFVKYDGLEAGVK